MSILLLLPIFYSANVFASDTNGMVTQNSLFRLGAEQVTLPGNESLGLVNTSYQLEAFPGFFVGGSVYGAATGNRGGFFTIGPEFTWRNRLPGHWYADLGLFVGGGRIRAVNGTLNSAVGEIAVVFAYSVESQR